MKKLYNTTIALLALTSIAFLILDLSNAINLTKAPYKQIDLIILLIFVVDYVVRFIKSKRRSEFFVDNIFDLIAIIPFNAVFSAFRIFRVFRLLKFTKLAKLSRVVKATAFIGVIKSRIGEILKTNGFIYVLYANIAMVLTSSIIIMFVEKMSYGDSVWWCLVTCTTIGYGDIIPVTPIGRILAVVLMIFGIGLIGMLTGAITTYFTAHNSKTDFSKGEELDTLLQNMNEEQKEKLLEIAKIIFDNKNQ